jgi:hypothetical protein
VQLGDLVDKLLFFPFPENMTGKRCDSDAYRDAKHEPQHSDPSFSGLQAYYALPAAHNIQKYRAASREEKESGAGK